MRSLLLALVLLLSAEAWAQPAVRTLHPGEAQADSLAAGSVHVYTFELEADRFVRAEVDQLSVDVEVRVLGPDGARLARADGPPRGPERVQFESEVAGTHRIEVRPTGEGAGRYRVLLARVEPVADTPERRVDQLMADFDDDETPGGVVAVVKDGALVFARAYGMADLTHGIPFTVETRTNIGSTSKQFTAFALALLDARGALSLDDDVRQHLPELPDLGATVTLRHLLTHTSGYREFLNTLGLAGRRIGEGDPIHRDEIVALVQRQPALQNAPGAEWNYNNTGYSLATRVVEAVTGVPFDRWMEKEVFGPLGMAHTSFRQHPRRIVPNSARGYAPADGGGFEEAIDLGGAMGPGGVYTTVGDLARWVAQLQRGTLGGPAVVEAMTTPFVLTDGDTTGYGLGLFLDTFRGQRRIHHGGADVAHRSMLAYYPDLATAIITQSNNARFPGSIADAVAETFLAQHLAPAAAAGAGTFDPATYDAARFDDFTGRYELDAMPGFVLTFTRSGDSLFTQATNQPRIQIFPTSDTTFALRVVAASVTFHRAPDGRVPSITLHQNGNHKARRITEAPWAPTADQLAAYAGRYFSAELEAFYTIAVEGGDLVVQHRRLPDLTLTARAPETFSGTFPMANVVFQRDDAGQVTAFLASNGRTRDVRFERVVE